ncbi:unnamed protein product [Gongylonema pulchrum]|uniref:CBFD_NFYB_HMF domain-containing protein n=1 Tax=Gongylonema pulchrum TaxID=637853 RepID=A0A183DUD6_9BILA|nr:unnamed protein product [Gongylonema pulchrum]
MASSTDSDSNDDQPLATFRKTDNAENETPSASTSALHDLPLARVKTIMQSGGEQVPISSEGLYAMTKAAELFISKLARESYEASDRPKCIEYSHLADYVQENDELEFLHGCVFFLEHIILLYFP